jgi:hypothetical protein
MSVKKYELAWISTSHVIWVELVVPRVSSGAAPTIPAGMMYKSGRNEISQSGGLQHKANRLIVMIQGGRVPLRLSSVGWH